MFVNYVCELWIRMGQKVIIGNRFGHGKHCSSLFPIHFHTDTQLSASYNFIRQFHTTPNFKFRIENRKIMLPAESENTKQVYLEVVSRKRIKNLLLLLIKTTSVGPCINLTMCLVWNSIIWLVGKYMHKV